MFTKPLAYSMFQTDIKCICILQHSSVGCWNSLAEARKETSTFAWSVTYLLTRQGRVTHICVSKLTIIGSNNSLSPGQCKAIIWTSAGKLSIRPLGTNFSEIIIKIYIFIKKNAFEIVVRKLVAILSRPQFVNDQALQGHQQPWYRQISQTISCCLYDKDQLLNLFSLGLC